MGRTSMTALKVSVLGRQRGPRVPSMTSDRGHHAANGRSITEYARTSAFAWLMVGITPMACKRQGNSDHSERTRGLDNSSQGLIAAIKDELGLIACKYANMLNS